MWRVHFYLIVVNLIYGANYTIAKIAMPQYVEPLGFVMIRVPMALILFSLFHRFMIREKVERGDMVKLAACALFGVAVNQMFFFKGLSITSEINASLIMITAPIMVLLISRIVLGESMNLVKIAGILIGGAGVAYLILQGKAGAPGNSNIWGDLLVLINAASYGLYLVMVKPLMNKYHGLTVIKWVFFFGMFMVIPFGYTEFIRIPWEELPLKAWLSIVYVIIFTTFFTYLLNILALKRSTPTLVGTYIYTQPLIASIIAISVGNDKLTSERLLAAFLIITGVYLVSNHQFVRSFFVNESKSSG